jgi:GDP-mannose transporter
LESSVVVGGGGKGLGKGTTTYGSTPQLSSATTTGLITSPISNIRRGHSSRSFMGSRISLVDDVEEGIIERQAKERQFRSRNQSVMSGLAYCISSSSMILLNKLLLSGYGLTGGISLMFYQV